MPQIYEVRNKTTSLLLSTIGREHDDINQAMRAEPTDNFFQDDTVNISLMDYTQHTEKVSGTIVAKEQ